MKIKYTFDFSEKEVRRLKRLATVYLFGQEEGGKGRLESYIRARKHIVDLHYLRNDLGKYFGSVGDSSLWFPLHFLEKIMGDFSSVLDFICSHSAINKRLFDENGNRRDKPYNDLEEMIKNGDFKEESK